MRCQCSLQSWQPQVTLPAGLLRAGHAHTQRQYCWQRSTMAACRISDAWQQGITLACSEADAWLETMLATTVGAVNPKAPTAMSPQAVVLLGMNAYTICSAACTCQQPCAPLQASGRKAGMAFGLARRTVAV